MARKLRIAVSALFGVLTLLLVVLWVRSHFYVHSVQTASHPRYILSSGNGYLILARTKSAIEPELIHYVFAETSGGYPPFSGSTIGDTTFLSIPYWIPVFFAAAASLLLARFHSFSLRTLLIGTTLLAVILGLAVWAGQ